MWNLFISLHMKIRNIINDWHPILFSSAYYIIRMLFCNEFYLLYLTIFLISLAVILIDGNRWICWKRFEMLSSSVRAHNMSLEYLFFIHEIFSFFSIFCMLFDCRLRMVLHSIVIGCFSFISLFNGICMYTQCALCIQ